MRKSMKSVPTPRALTERQRTRQAIAWILKAAEKGRRVTAKREERIAKEVLAILEGESEVFKWLEQRHKEAALARYVLPLLLIRRGPNHSDQTSLRDKCASGSALALETSIGIVYRP
jgi:hypothetical protein